MCCGRSPKPNTMVAVVRSPSACPWRITSIQVSVVHLSGEIAWRISSSRISAPPPGIESSPAAISRSTTARIDMFSISAM